MASPSNPLASFAACFGRDETFLHAVFSQLPYGVAIFDNSLRVIFVSETLDRALREEERPRDGSFSHIFGILRFIDPKTLETVPRERLPAPRALAGETVAPERYLIRRIRSGGSLWVEGAAWPLRDASGLIQGAMMTIRDITAECREALARDAASQMRDFVYHGNLAGIIHSTIDGRIIDCNDAAVRMFRFHSKDEMLSHREQQLYTDPLERDRLLRSLSRTHQVNEFEVCCRRADGAKLWAMVNARLIDPQPGEVGGTLVAILLDITERRRHEDVLRASEERFSAFMRHLPGVAFIKDLEGRYLYYNDASERLFGRKPSEFVGKTDPEIWPETHEEYRANDRKVIESGTHAEFVESVHHPDGVHSWLVYKFPIVSNGRVEYVGGVGIDITERQMLSDQLNDARKMESLGRLAGGVAHDFNNHLTVISGYGQMALEGVGHTSAEKMIAYLQNILNSARRASGLTGQLLAFSRKQVAQQRTLDLGGLLRNMQMLLQRVIGENVDLAVRTGSGHYMIRGDANHVEQVIMNLAVNARDAMPLGGSLEIECSRLDVPVINEDGRELRILLEVRDNGIGMEEDVKVHIFEPFFTRKEKGKGTGLGLSTVYGIVTQAGGQIEVDSQPGEGTAFRILFPEAEGDVEPAAPPARTLLADEASETVLLVEDEPAVRSLAATILTRLGYCVLAADSGPAALDIWKQRSADIDALVTDVIMPQMSGAELAQKLRAMKPDLPVLFMSGYTDDMIARQGIAPGEIPILTKPFTAESLAANVRDLLQS